MKFTAIVVGASIMIASHIAFAQSNTRGSQGSMALSAGSAEIVSGSVDIAASSGRLIVLSMETLGQSTVVTLGKFSEGVEGSATFSIRVSGTASLAVGTAVEVLAVAGGYVLSSLGQAVAFVPNEIGRALLYHHRLTERK
jgi:hypothetical protein